MQHRNTVDQTTIPAILTVSSHFLIGIFDDTWNSLCCFHNAATAVGICRSSTCEVFSDWFAQLYAYATSDAGPEGAHCLLYMMLMQLQLNLE